MSDYIDRDNSGTADLLGEWRRQNGETEYKRVRTSGGVGDEAARNKVRRGSPVSKSGKAHAGKSAGDAAQRAGRHQGRNTSAGIKKKRPSGPDYRDIIILLAIAALIIMFAGFCVSKVIGALSGDRTAADQEISYESLSESEDMDADETASESEATAQNDIYAKVRLLADQYDYDAALELLSAVPDYDSDAAAQALAAEYEEIRGTLKEQDISEITHVFFHILSVDPEVSFNEEILGSDAGKFNSLMTTVSEFKDMIEELYNKGYVLVSIRDLAHEETAEDGTVKMVKGSIMLPPGKKALVMSEDDVCYYEYMKDAGFSDKVVLDSEGKPVNHYTDSDGNEYTGAYDLPSILDEFIEEHPDFSYKGHKACLAFTGYNGILGYRTDESYDSSSEYYDSSLESGHDVAEERKEAVKVLKALYEDGYDFASHSWGHRDLGQIEYDRFKTDCDRWDRNVASLIEEATGSRPDIIIFPRGADIEDWHAYSSDNDRFEYLYDLGFRYYCNVDNTQYWVQLGDNYLRQGRRALDGYCMWLQVSGQNDRLSDLFDDVSAIFDESRPTPVQSY